MPSYDTGYPYSFRTKEEYKYIDEKFTDFFRYDFDNLNIVDVQ